MEGIRTILAATDFSAAAQAAVRQAIRLANECKAKLLITHVIDEEVVADLGRSLNVKGPKLRANLVSETLKRMRSSFKSGELQKAKGEFVVLIGHPFASLVDLTNKRGVDLIVMAANSYPKAGTEIGALAARCVRKAPTNVLLVRQQKTNAFKRVTCVVDFSSMSVRAAQTAVSIARNDNAKLEFLHVYCPPWDILHYKSLGSGTGDVRYKKQYVETLRAEFDSFLRGLRQDLKGYPCVQQLVRGTEVKTAIVAHIQKAKSDLVVLGTRGRTGFKVLLMGTTAEHIVHKTLCSVLAAKPKGFSYKVK